MIPFGAVFSAEPADYEWKQDICYALDAAGLSDKQAAALMGVTPAQFAAWMNFSSHWSGWRERKLPREFHIALYKRRLDRWQHETIARSELLDLVMEVKRMVKARLWLSGQDQERKRA